MDGGALLFAWCTFLGFLDDEIGAVCIILIVSMLLMIALEIYSEHRYERHERDAKVLELCSAIMSDVVRKQIDKILEKSRFDEEVEEP